MNKNLKKLLMTLPVICALNFSLISSNVQAVEKKDKDNKQVVVQEVEAENDKDTKLSSDKTEENLGEDKVSADETLENDENKVEEGEPEVITPHWENIDGKLHYVTEDGIVEKTGWFTEKDENPDADNDNEYYLDENFSAVTGWQKINNNWYHFDDAGVKQTGWNLIDYEWYHFDESGVMEKGWIEVDRSKYYLNDEGKMIVGKKYLDGKWYFFGGDGILETGIYTNNGKLYYSDKDGVMVANQWIDIRTNSYYVKADSSLAIGQAIIDGKLETFDSNGKHKTTSNNIKDIDNLFVEYLNVGNADCAFLKLPNGETALIDTGDVTTRDKLINFLKKQDLRKVNGRGIIDYIIVTHAHSDHIGGLEAVLENFEVNKVYLPENAVMKDWYSNLKVSKDVSAEDIEMLKYDYEVYNDAVKAMKRNKLKFTDTKKGEYIDKNRILQFVESDKDFGGIGSQEHLAEYWGINENSAVVYLNYGDFQALFTADMEWNSEKDFWVNDLLNKRPVDLLKVPHHGHDTSSTGDFLKYLKAPVGVISRGEDKVSEDAVAYQNLLNNGVSIYETSKAKNDGIAVYATEDNWTLEQ